ncbi:phosphatase PAP2 family protein [Kutzneria sp. CA-103260]|uniref:phosphatase PAP2 family protein n=1 Tax=Kutzneria sp. CA-103260 TaxID=2802641 RepID=UPI001BA9F8F7|nr:phosphatase PAP2 family protein [Kutzneria sp. CA-103260]QUQ69394.1 PAP2 superfamily protein [Kutzneria sp. CA-103260]
MRLLPPQARRSAVGLVVLSVVVVAVGAALYHGQQRAGRLDDAVDDWLFTVFGQHRVFLYQLLHVADLPVVIAVLVVVLVAALMRGRPDIAALAAIGPLASIGLTEAVLKPLVHRRYNFFLSYPSGHTVGTASECAVLGVILLGATGLTLALRVAMGVLLLVVCATVMLALIVDDFHYFTDTVAGASLSVGVVALTALAVDAVTRRRVLAAAPV